MNLTDWHFWLDPGWPKLSVVPRSSEAELSSATHKRTVSLFRRQVTESRTACIKACFLAGTPVHGVPISRGQ